MSDTFLNIEDRASTPFAISQALSQALEILGSNFLLFISVSALANLPNLYFDYQVATHRDDVWTYTAYEMLSDHIFGSLLIAMIVFATFQHLRGRPVRLGESIAHGLAPFFSVVGTSILVTIIVVIGLILLFVPGIIFNAMLAVAIPACVVERLGPGKSLARSRNLTDGYKGGIFGAFFAIGIANSVVSFGVGAAFGHAGQESLFALSLFAWSTLISCYIAIVSTVIYHGLRSTKEGIDINQIAAVFD